MTSKGRPQWWKAYWKQIVLFLTLLGLVALFICEIITAGEAAALSTPLLAALVAFSLYETVYDKRLQDSKRLEVERENESQRRDYEREREAQRLEEERESESQRRNHERERDRLVVARQERAAVYTDIVEHGIASFTGSSFEKSERAIRSQIALWGSPTFIESYLSWRRVIEPYSGKGRVPVEAGDLARVQEALAALISAARADVDIDPTGLASIQSLASVVFNDYVEPYDAADSSGP